MGENASVTYVGRRVMQFIVTVITDFLCKINPNCQKCPPKKQAKGCWKPV